MAQKHVARRLARNSIPGRKRAKGKGCEYCLSDLPEDWQEVLLDMAGESVGCAVPGAEISAVVAHGPEEAAGSIPAPALPIEPEEEVLAKRAAPVSAAAARVLDRVGIPDVLPADKPTQRAYAKIAILQAHADYCADKGLAVVDCEYRFADAYKNGEIEVPAWVRSLYGSVSRGSLTNWKRTLKSGELLALRGQAGLTKRLDKITSNPHYASYCQAALVQFPSISARKLYDGLNARFKGQEIPSLPTVRRWLDRWKAENKQVYALIQSPDDWKNRYMPAHGSYSEGVKAVNELWELDSTPADLMLADGRYNLVGCIDVYSRRLKLLVTQTSQAVAIIALMRRCILDWGVPGCVKTDNGKDYTALHIQNTLLSLGVEHRLCTPFSPEQKPHIERGLGSFLHDLVEILPGYVGHSVAERQAIRSRKGFAERFGEKGLELPLDRVGFQAICDQWTDELYANRKHSSIGMTPAQRSAGAEVRRVKDERQLDLLLAESVSASVQKKGIRLKNTWYSAPELGGMIGDRVHLRLPEDAGHIYIFRDASCAEFICVATAEELIGENRIELARKAKAWANKQKAAVRSLRKLAEQQGIENMPDEILAEARDTAERIAAMPGRADEYALPPAAEEALVFMDRLERQPQATPLTAEQREIQDRLIAEANAPVVSVEQPEDRYQRLYLAVQRGEDIPDTDRDWMRDIRANPHLEWIWTSAELIGELYERNQAM